MNNKIPAVFLFLAASALAAFTACSKQERTQASDKAAEAYDSAKTTAANAWDSVKHSTYDSRDAFNKELKALNSKFDANVAELRANYDEAKASASRKAAMDELKSADADFKEKMSAVGKATSDTWESVRSSTVASWDRLEAAYQKARAEK
jgi:Skp family chaperone for outer membrane proteins